MGMDFAHAFRHLFKKSGMTQAELCRRGGFSRAYVSMLLSGKVDMPKFDRACEIADALGVTDGVAGSNPASPTRRNSRSGGKPDLLFCFTFSVENHKQP